MAKRTSPQRLHEAQILSSQLGEHAEYVMRATDGFLQVVMEQLMPYERWYLEHAVQRLAAAFNGQRTSPLLVPDWLKTKPPAE